VKIPLPNLDDRRWIDLVDEARSLIPFYAPDWTDHNIHDPGITLIELLASITEMDIYQLNRIPDRHKRKFLELLGIWPEPPRAARTVLSLSLSKNLPPQRLKATAEFEGEDPFGQQTRFRTLESITIAPGEMAAIQIKDAKEFHNLTDKLKRGEPFGAFGAAPELGSELYLGFTDAFSRRRLVSLYFKFDGSRSGEDERMRLIEEARAQKIACCSSSSEIPCEKRTPPPVSYRKSEPKHTPAHRGVRLVWEFLAKTGTGNNWMPLEPGRGGVNDETRSLTLDGRVLFRLPSSMAEKQIGAVPEPLYYIRCRFEAGAYDSPPVLQTVFLNAVAVEQAIPFVTTLTIGKGVVAHGKAPLPGRMANLRLALNQLGRISSLSFDAGEAGDPKFRVLGFTPASDSKVGSLTVEAAFIGRGDGLPNQVRALPESPVQEASLRIYSFEAWRWRSWTLQRDFDVSGRSDSHFLLDATSGTVIFGDGNRGHVPPPDALIFAVYRSTRAASGNLDQAKINKLSDSAHNRALIANLDALIKDTQVAKARLASITNPIAATLGSAAETLTHAEGRAIEAMGEIRRAVTLDDYKLLAMQTPGARLARVDARANLHPSFPCFKAPGMITLIILPDMPVSRPTPSRALRRAVADYLHRRRVIGTRVDVVGPTYLEVAVRATVQSLYGTSKQNLQQKIIDALNTFLDPLKGGPEGTGWPFGRDVFRSEILQVIDEVAGVDHIIKLELIAEGCDAQCGNICLGPTWLVAAGQHQIEVV
jgi:Baseplate J-like protein